MFSLNIVDTDSFVEMPGTSQLLYFHLAIRADDEGFVSSPKRIMRMLGSSEDDFKVLVAKKFIIPFESGVCVISHWLIHNTIRMDRFNKTTYEDEKKQLVVRENKVYKLIPIEQITDDGSKIPIQNNDRNMVNQMATKWQPNGNQRLPQVKLSKVNSSKVKIAEKSSTSIFSSQGAEILKMFEGVDPINKKYYANKTQRSACEFLLKEYGIDKVRSVIEILPITNKKPRFEFPFVNTPDLLMKNWVKIIDGIEALKIKQVESKNKVAF